MRLVAVLVFLQTAAVVDFSLGIVLLVVLAVAAAYVRCFFLRESAQADEQQKGRHRMARTLSENIQTGNHFVLTVEDEEINHEQQ